MNGTDLLRYGLPGLVALMVVLIVVPIVRAFVEELAASRAERREMRDQFDRYVTVQAKAVTEALTQVRDGLDDICRRLRERE